MAGGAASCPQETAVLQNGITVWCGVPVTGYAQKRKAAGPCRDDEKTANQQGLSAMTYRSSEDVRDRFVHPTYKSG
jgi:hypothetical protein